MTSLSSSMIGRASPLLRVVSLVGVLVLVGASALPASAARGQGVDPGAHLELVSMPPWHEPGDKLDIDLKVVNSGKEPLEGYSLAVSIFQRVLSRSALHASYTDPGEFEIGLFTKSFGVRVPPGRAASVSLRGSTRDLAALDGATESGVYPVKIELFDSTGVLLDDAPITIPLIYYPSPPQEPLNLSLTLPLDDIARADPKGSLVAGGSARSPLENALGRSGWLFETVRALEKWTRPEPKPPPLTQGRAGGKARSPDDEPARPARRDLRAAEGSTQPGGLRLGLAPTPRLMEEIAAMRNGYRRAVADKETEVPAGSPGALAAQELLQVLDSILGRDSVQPMLGPYASADLTALQNTSLDFSDSTGIQQQLNVGERVLDNLFRTDFEPDWIFAPEGRLDEPTLDTLKLGNRADKALFGTGSLRGARDPSKLGCPEGSPSWLCPISTDTKEGTTGGYIVDDGLTGSLAELGRAGDDPLDLQKVLAETATIWAELPGRSGRIVHATTPSPWRPRPHIIRLLLEDFASAPWLASVTPEEGLVGLQPPKARTVVEQVKISRAERVALLTLDPASAQETIENFASMGPPDDVLERLRRNILVSQSKLWWASSDLARRGQTYAASAQAEANHAMSQVRIGAPSRITLTSRRGKIKFEVFNDAAYEVEVGVSLTSPQLNLDKHFVKTIPAGKQVPLQVQASAETSGTYQVSVRIETPDGYIVPDSETDIFVRSTVFNRIALGLTIGAFAFLVFFYLYRAIRRRRAQPGGRRADAQAA